MTSGLRVVEVPIPTRYFGESSSISVTRSLEYVTHGTGYARAPRSPVAAAVVATSTGLATRANDAVSEGPLAVRRCVACSNERMALRHPSNADGDEVPGEEFRCTTSALGVHDDIYECPRCGLLSSAPTISPDAIIDGYEEVVDEDYLERGG